MPEYRELVRANEDDLDSPTIVASLPAGPPLFLPGPLLHYYLPTRMVPPFEQALDALERGEQQPLVEYCQLLQVWFDQRHPWPDGHLLFIAHYEKERTVKLHHNNHGKISFLEVSRLDPDPNQMVILHTIAVDDFAKLLMQPGAIDELGDQFFGEGEWQKLKQWMSDAD